MGLWKHSLSLFVFDLSQRKLHMLKKTMTYEDLNGNQVTEDFYFALSKAELAELEITGGPEGFSGMLARIATEEDTKEMLRIFKDIIKMTVGRKSEDGKRFEKTEQITLEFMQCPAYSDLLMTFYTDSGAAAEFISGCVPSDLAAVVDAEIGKQNVEVVELPDGSKDVVTTETQ